MHAILGCQEEVSSSRKELLLKGVKVKTIFGLTYHSKKLYHAEKDRVAIG
jgi:hypothetical protein